MKTTLDLPEELIKELKLRAVHEGKKLKEVATEALQRGLAIPGHENAPAHPRHPLPLIECQIIDPTAAPTPERIAAILTDQETGWAGDASRR